MRAELVLYIAIPSSVLVFVATRILQGRTGVRGTREVEVQQAEGEIEGAAHALQEDSDIESTIQVRK